METTKQKLVTGMRVRLVSSEDSVLWCAGRIPVGATGTIYLMPPANTGNAYRMLGIDWDHYKSNSPRFAFGMAEKIGEDVPDYLEPIS
jgi:hypothetical protein